jgi:hypothetical protein
MKIKVDFDTKQIEIIGEVNLGEFSRKIMDLGLDVEEWSVITKVEYVLGNIFTTPNITPYRNPFEPYVTY